MIALSGRKSVLIMKMGRYDQMMDAGIHNLVADCGLKGMRICEFPIKSEESIVIDDRLEEEGRLRL